MSASALAADGSGAGIQQHLVGAVPSVQTAHGDYGVHVGVTHVLPGAESDSLRHDVPEVVLVVTGELEMWTDGIRRTITAGDHFVIEAGAWHEFANCTDEPAAMVFAFGGDPAPVTTSRKPADALEGNR